MLNIHKLKMPFITTNKHIDLHVYCGHSVFHNLGFMDMTHKTKIKHMKRPKEPKKTMASCYGLIEMQKNSVTLKSWQDWNIEVGEENVQINPLNFNLMSWNLHERVQSNGWGDKNNIDILKVDSPFMLECEEDINWVLSCSPFCKQNLHIPSGLVNFKYLPNLNFFLYLHRDNPSSITFTAGDSIACITPMSGKKVKVHNHYDNEKWKYLFDKGADIMSSDQHYRKKQLYKEAEHG